MGYFAFVGGFVLTLVFSILEWIVIFRVSNGLFPPIVGDPSLDPGGRGVIGAVAILGIGGYFAAILSALVGGWIAFVISERENWTFDNIASACIYLVFSGITAANYSNQDGLITRDAQALMNILLACAGATLVPALQSILIKARSRLWLMLGSSLLALFIYAFIATPLWFTFSYTSWKLGNGELDSLEGAAKMIGAAASILTSAGLAWKVKLANPPNPTDD
ncbi:hypothetical protein ACCC98_26995 [Rhizobium pisi]|uniref:hypothetical protein n=1 Tax=Rhizobium pisi TaxID=574561 RepID=UPI0039B025EC